MVADAFLWVLNRTPSLRRIFSVTATDGASNKEPDWLPEPRK